MLSLTMIVRNEEAVLGRCLDSIKDAVDEIVIVDTGSTDRTKEIAARYTEKIYDFAWINDFAAARQFALDRATGDWALWLDADDVVYGAAHIKGELVAAATNVEAIYWAYNVSFDEVGNATCSYWRERCVRNNGHFRWQGKIHETLNANTSIESIKSQQVHVEHRPQVERFAQKQRRNLTIIEAEYQALVASDQPIAPRLRFYLGNELAREGAIDQAIDAYESYLRVGIWPDEMVIACLSLANLHRSQNDFERAIEAALRALKFHPEWPLAYFDLARTYYFLQDWQKVVHWVDIGAEMKPPDSLAVLNPMDWRFNWIIYATNAFYHVGRLADALRWTQKALEIVPTDAYHRANLALFEKALHTSVLTSIEQNFQQLEASQ